MFELIVFGLFCFFVIVLPAVAAIRLVFRK